MLPACGPCCLLTLHATQVLRHRPNTQSHVQGMGVAITCVAELRAVSCKGREGLTGWKAQCQGSVVRVYSSPRPYPSFILPPLATPAFPNAQDPPSNCLSPLQPQLLKGLGLKQPAQLKSLISAAQQVGVEFNVSGLGADT